MTDSHHIKNTERHSAFLAGAPLTKKESTPMLFIAPTADIISFPSPPRPRSRKRAKAPKLPRAPVVSLLDRRRRQDWTREEIARLVKNNVKNLPFVKLKPNAQPMWEPLSYWHVSPERDFTRNMEMGRQFAWQAVGAMHADQHERLLNMILMDMLRAERAAKTKAERGRLFQIRLGFFKTIGDIILQMGRCIDAPGPKGPA